MQVVRHDAETVLITGIDLFCAEMLRQITSSAQAGEGDAAHGRLFPSPTERNDARLEADWKSYVVPDLKELFQSATGVVQDDLACISEDLEEPSQTVQIPVAHLWSWINALNQARLAIAARHSIGEAEMEDIPEIADARGLGIFQIHLYGHLQECFLQFLEEEEGTPSDR